MMFFVACTLIKCATFNWMTRVGLLISAILFANLKKREKTRRSKTISVIALEISSLQLDLVCALFFSSSSSLRHSVLACMKNGDSLKSYPVANRINGASSGSEWDLVVCIARGRFTLNSIISALSLVYFESLCHYFIAWRVMYSDSYGVSSPKDNELLCTPKSKKKKHNGNSEM